jgi:SAM-dependent methyltransferase
MLNNSSDNKNWFDQGGAAYAQFRPEYPPELAQFLGTIALPSSLAVDVGCGNGQLTVQLAEHFDQVLGLDPSADQIANAQTHERVRYLCAPAEKLPVDAASVGLITAAQAAHWFDLPAFYAEARRVGKKDAVIALISYGVLELDEALQARFDTFYRSEIGPYWPAERKLVDSGYRDIAFPFHERAAPPMEIRKQWNLSELLGYISTWSAVRKAKEAGRASILASFAEELAALWGDGEQRRRVAWPINMRLGSL